MVSKCISAYLYSWIIGGNFTMYSVIREKRSSGLVVNQNKDIHGVEYLTFPNLDETGVVQHLFSTRIGGVSEGIYSSMNLSFTREDNPGHVEENYRRIASIFGVDVQRFVCSDQTHTTNIRVITEEDCGKGITRARDYNNIDGLITNVPNIVLTTLYADCVPLYFVDPIQKVAGLAHSGWKGTVNKIGAKMIEKMKHQFGCETKNIQVAIGPSICQDCYEVSEDVAIRFEEIFAEQDSLLKEIAQSRVYKENPQVVIPGSQIGKYQLDLWLANLLVLRQVNIPLDNISITDICTCENSEYLFSHRASHGKRGNLGAFLMLRES